MNKPSFAEAMEGKALIIRLSASTKGGQVWRKPTPSTRGRGVTSMEEMHEYL